MLRKFAKRVGSPDEIPDKKHFAILIFTTSSVHVPGDERSRTNPGHGYPAHDVTSSSYEYWIIGTKKNLVDAIRHLEKQKQDPWNKISPYRVIEASSVKVSTGIEVKISP